MKTAFFDSGIGGLSVLHHAMKILPNEEFIFYADEDNVPYGTKTRAEILNFVARKNKSLVERFFAWLRDTFKIFLFNNRTYNLELANVELLDGLLENENH